MADDNRALVGRILLGGAVVLALLAVLCWAGRLPVDPRARTVLAAALTASALADGMIGFVFLTMSGRNGARASEGRQAGCRGPRRSTTKSRQS